MRTIWKYQVPLIVHRHQWSDAIKAVHDFELEIPRGGTVLSVQMQTQVGADPAPQLWILVDPARVPETRKFRTVGTGREVGEENVIYVGTFQPGPTGLVFHLFEVIAP